MHAMQGKERMLPSSSRRPAPDRHRDSHDRECGRTVAVDQPRRQDHEDGDRAQQGNRRSGRASESGGDQLAAAGADLLRIEGEELLAALDQLIQLGLYGRQQGIGIGHVAGLDGRGQTLEIGQFVFLRVAPKDIHRNRRHCIDRL